MYFYLGNYFIRYFFIIRVWFKIEENIRRKYEDIDGQTLFIMYWSSREEVKVG